MANSASSQPLLSEYYSNSAENLNSNSNSNSSLNEEHHIPIPIAPTLDSTIERFIGDLGWPQVVQAVLISLAWMFDAQQTFLSVFTDADPSWHCTDSTTSNSSCSSDVTDVCLLPKDASWGWDLPAHTSIISEWGLQCSGSFVAGLPESSFFAGCLIGGLVLATLADSTLGRKNMLFVGTLLMSLTSLATSLSTNVWIYSGLRFLCGFGRATIGTCSLVLATELVGKKWRGQVGVLGFLCFTLGFLSLPAMALINRCSSWRNLYLWTSIPTILYCFIVHFLVRESPRWLFVRGRRDEAIETLKSISNNKSQPPHMEDDNNNIMSSLGMSLMSFSSLPLDHETGTSADLYSTIKIMLDKTWALKRLSMVMAIGVGIGLMYYGMPLSLGSLGLNLYLSVTFNALSEIPASLLTFLMIGTVNRKTGIVALTGLSSICSIAAAIVGDMNISWWMSMGLELLAFSSACTAFNVLQILTLELFPTCVRNSAVSMVRQALVMGGVLSPLLAAAGRGGSLFMSYGVFGLAIGCCGMFVVCLPETRGRPISDTMDEEEHRADADSDTRPV